MTFKTLKELNEYILNAAEHITQETTHDISSDVKNVIWEELYFARTPDTYVRSFDYVHSVDYTYPKTTKKGVVSTKVFYDTSRIHPELGTGNNPWNIHMDINGNKTVTNKKAGKWKGKKITELIPLWLDGGTNSPLYSHDGTKAMSSVFDEYNKSKLKEAYKKGFLDFGIKAE